MDRTKEGSRARFVAQIKVDAEFGKRLNGVNKIAFSSQKAWRLALLVGNIKVVDYKTLRCCLLDKVCDLRIKVE